MENYEYRLERMTMGKILESWEWNKKMLTKLTNHLAIKCFENRLAACVAEMKKRKA